MHHPRTTPHKSTQRLDSSHCDELQARPPTIERPFQIYLTHRTTRLKRRRPNDTQVPLRTAENPPVLTNHPRFETPTRNPPSERQPLSTFSPQLHSSSSTSIAPPSTAWGSHHVRAIYAALDVSGVRGDGYKDGEKLTRARVKN